MKKRQVAQGDRDATLFVSFDCTSPMPSGHNAVGELCCGKCVGRTGPAQ